MCYWADGEKTGETKTGVRLGTIGVVPDVVEVADLAALDVVHREGAHVAAVAQQELLLVSARRQQRFRFLPRPIPVKPTVNAHNAPNARTRTARHDTR